MTILPQVSPLEEVPALTILPNPQKAAAKTVQKKTNPEITTTEADPTTPKSAPKKRKKAEPKAPPTQQITTPAKKRRRKSGKGSKKRRPKFTSLLTPEPLPATLTPLELDYVYMTILAQAKHHCPDHKLILLKESGFKIEAIVSACGRFQHSEGPGRPPRYKIKTLVCAEIVRVWAGSCSDPELEELLATNIVVRWFCELPIIGPSPDHATLARFHAWVSQNAPDAFFKHTLQFLDEVDPEENSMLHQIVDSFAMGTPAQRMGIPEMIYACLRQIQLIWTMLPLGGPELPLDEESKELLAHKPLLYKAAQRAEALGPLVVAAQKLAQAITPLLTTLPREPRDLLTQYLTYLAKISKDEIFIDEEGKVVERNLKFKGKLRLGCLNDVEATFRNHGHAPATLGFNAFISITATRICEAIVLTGSASDSLGPRKVLEAELAAGRPLPPTLGMDMAGGSGKVRHDVAQISAGQTMMVVRTKTTSERDGHLTPADFRLSSDAQSCTCPQQRLSYRKTKHSEGAFAFVFTSEQCEGCPLRPKCWALQVQDDPPAETAENTETAEKARVREKVRRVYFSLYQEELRQAQEFNQTEQGQALLGVRFRVEAAIAWLVRYDGARRTRRVGQRAAQFHLYQACAMRNLWLWLGRGAPGAPGLCQS